MTKDDWVFFLFFFSKGNDFLSLVVLSSVFHAGSVGLVVLITHRQCVLPSIGLMRCHSSSEWCSHLQWLMAPPMAVAFCQRCVADAFTALMAFSLSEIAVFCLRKYLPWAVWVRLRWESLQGIPCHPSFLPFWSFLSLHLSFLCGPKAAQGA